MEPRRHPSRFALTRGEQRTLAVIVLLVALGFLGLVLLSGPANGG